MVGVAAGREFPGVVMLSRRRGRRRQYQYRLPDWVWGAALGLVVLIGAGGYFLLTGGGGGATCDEPLPDLPGNSNISAEGFDEEDRQLGLTLQYLSAGDIDNTFATFYGDVHAFTHNVDSEIRAVDEEMAKELCENVIAVEESYDPPPPEQPSLSTMINTTQALREKLRDVAEALGFPRPSG